MALPRSIQAQVEQANATLEAFNKPPEPIIPEAQIAAPQPDPEPQDPSPAQAVEPPAPAPQPDQWEHKYKTLQGLFNREVPTLQTKVKDLEGKLADAIERLNKAAEPKPSAPEPATADPKDVENFGSDLVEMVQRTAERMFGRAANELQAQAARFEQRLAQLEQGLQGTSSVVAASAEQAFFDRLTKMVPDWEQTNANDAFLAWLAEVDPILGQPRQTALDAAQQTMNADRAAAVFKAFAATRPAASRSSSVDRQVSPKGNATPTPTPEQKPILTEKQIVAFYDARRRGEYRGRDQEAAQIEQMINLAIAEGRVQ